MRVGIGMLLSDLDTSKKKIVEISLEDHVELDKPYQLGDEPEECLNQHCIEKTKQFKEMLTEVEVVMLDKTEDIFTEFKKAYERDGSTLLIEHGDFYNDI